MESDLSDAEINAICAGLKQSAAKVRFLREQNLVVRRKPNGQPLVNRKHYDEVMTGTPKLEAVRADPSNEPKWGKKA